MEMSVTQSSSQSQSEKKKSYNTVDDAFSLVDTVKGKMDEISGVLSSMDKRMAFNLRLIASVTHDVHSQFHEESSYANKELIKVLQQKTVQDKIKKITPKIKPMEHWTKVKLNLNNPDGQSILNKFHTKVCEDHTPT